MEVLYKKTQDKILRNFKEIVKVFEVLEIQYFICGGVLVSAVENNKWRQDSADIDISLDIDSYAKLCNNLSRLPSNIFLQSIETDHLYTSNIPKFRDKNSCYLKFDGITSWHNGLQIDIFLINIKNNFIYSEHHETIIEYQDVFPLKQILFEDMQINIPNNYAMYIQKFCNKTVFDNYKKYGLIDPDNASNNDKLNYRHFYS
jgi:phosphorylcholine metabolism protein LicD